MLKSMKDVIRAGVDAQPYKGPGCWACTAMWKSTHQEWVDAVNRVYGSVLDAIYGHIDGGPQTSRACEIEYGDRYAYLLERDERGDWDCVAYTHKVIARDYSWFDRRKKA